MRHIYVAALLSLASLSPCLALDQSPSDEQAAARYHENHIQRLRTRFILEARQNKCGSIDCQKGGDDACTSNGCGRCAWDYLCNEQNETIPPPKANQMVIDDDAYNDDNKSPILTNFLEAKDLRDKWASTICTNLTSGDFTSNMNVWQYDIQGTHKKDLSLVHNKRYLNLFVSWVPVDPFILSQIPGQTVFDVCVRALGLAAGYSNALDYNFDGISEVYALKNEHKISISIPPPQRTQSDRTVDNTYAFIRIQQRDSNRNLKLFNHNGLPLPNKGGRR